MNPGPVLALFADSAVYGARGCRRELARGTRSELQAIKDERRAADDAEFRYSTCYSIEVIR
jgi:hypothetical protein